MRFAYLMFFVFNNFKPNNILYPTFERKPLPLGKG